ncbi:MAG: ImmA/IrrE family metallo-endopeptidase [Actinomycetes bacterium]
MSKSQATTMLVPSSDELVEHLLAETDQREVGPTDSGALVDFLGLRRISTNVAETLPEARTVSGDAVRALLDYQERLVVVDAAMDVRRSRFSSLHEIAHYVLPDHQGQIIVCGEQDLGFRAVRVEEREANAFAAGLQFKGRRFQLETASLPISALTVKETAGAFDASFESTARRLVETSLRPCLLAVYQDDGWDDDGARRTSVRYSIPSPSFEQRFGRRLTDKNNAHVAAVWVPGRDIADTVAEEVAIETGDGETTRFRAEYFFNGYSAFCLITSPRA